METNIIGIKYEDEFTAKTFRGKIYLYFTKLNLDIGDLVEAPTKYGLSIAQISKINISEEEIRNIRPYIKTITKKINRERYLNFSEILEEVA